jgi:hypothetical protein
MAVDVEIDVELLKSEIKETYAKVSEEPAPWTMGRLAPSERTQKFGARGTTTRAYEP